MVFATAEVVATDDPEGPGSARDTFPMLDATALASVAGTSMIMVFEATEAASAEDPVKSSGLGRDEDRLQCVSRPLGSRKMSRQYVSSDAYLYR